MLGLRHSLNLILFFTICLSVLFIGVYIRPENSMFRNSDKNGDNKTHTSQENFFKMIDFFSSKNGRPFLYLKASESSINPQTGVNFFFNPDGHVYDQENVPIYFDSKQGEFYELKEKLVLKTEVHARYNQGRLNSDKVTYLLGPNELTGIGRVYTSNFSLKNGDKIIIKSDRVISWPKKNISQYLGNVKGRIIRKRAYEYPIYFSSNKLILDLHKHLISLKGNVHIKREEVKARGLRGEIFLDNYNKKLKYYVLYDDVKLVEKIQVGDTTYERKAFAEKLEGILSEGVIILTGYPKVYQMQDIVKGNRIILRENNEVVEVDDANTKFKLK